MAERVQTIWGEYTSRGYSITYLVSGIPEREGGWGEGEGREERGGGKTEQVRTVDVKRARRSPEFPFGIKKSTIRE